MKGEKLKTEILRFLRKINRYKEFHKLFKTIFVIIDININGIINNNS